MGREDKELSVTGSLGGIKPAKGAKGREGQKERRRSRQADAGTQRGGDGASKCPGLSKGALMRGKAARSVCLYTDHHLRGQPSPALWDGSDGSEERTGRLAEAVRPGLQPAMGSPAPDPNLRTQLPHVTLRSSTRGSEGKGRRKSFLSLLFCSLGVLNSQQGGKRECRPGVCRKEGGGRVGQAAWEGPGRGLG